MENGVDILEKLEEKLKSILSLRIKIGLSQYFKEFDEGFEQQYIDTRLEELFIDVDDMIQVAEDDIRAEIDFDIEYEAEAEIEEEPWMA